MHAGGAVIIQISDHTDKDHDLRIASTEDLWTLQNSHTKVKTLHRAHQYSINKPDVHAMTFLIVCSFADSDHLVLATTRQSLN